MWALLVVLFEQAAPAKDEEGLEAWVFDPDEVSTARWQQESEVK